MGPPETVCTDLEAVYSGTTKIVKCTFVRGDLQVAARDAGESGLHLDSSKLTDMQTTIGPTLPSKAQSLSINQLIK